MSDQHAFSLLNGSSYADNSVPNYGPLYLLQKIAIDGFMHGKEACVVKLKSMAPLSSLYSALGVH